MALGRDWRAVDWRAVYWRAGAGSRHYSAPQLERACEIGMIAVVGLAAIGLGWAIFAPTTRTDGAGVAPVRFDATPAAFLASDPFFRAVRTGEPASVTALDLTLHGVRLDNVSGRGSAIIGLPDGTQNSYAVGDEILPGAVLAAVAIDSITIRRNGASETLYLDQGSAAPVVEGADSAVQPDPFAAIRAGAAPSPSLIADLNAEPRLRGGRIDGYVLKPGASGAAFAAAGLRAGDVLLTINGRSLGDGAGIEQLAGGTSAKLGIERDGAPMTIEIGARK